MNDHQPPKIIPKGYAANNVSPTEDRIVKIDKNGNVDFFIKCKEYYKGKGENEENTYYKFSFQVNKDFYDFKKVLKEYKTVNDFVETIKNTQINNLIAMIVSPEKELTKSYTTYYEKKIPNRIKIKIEDILNCMEGIGDGGWTIAMVKFLIDCGLKKEAIELFKKDNGKLVKIINDIKYEEFKLNLKEKDELLTKLVEGNKQLLKENKENEKLKEEKQKGLLYKKKDKGFLSIFSCCTCGLDNIAEKENEIKY